MLTSQEREQGRVQLRVPDHSTLDLKNGSGCNIRNWNSELRHCVFELEELRVEEFLSRNFKSYYLFFLVGGLRSWVMTFSLNLQDFAVF